ncbi:16S rRNA pseudouridine(516) synthase [Hathewaya limosa]|uniref:Pseudouridine synthase n=1 Tax=Hathewaya limosa TaxID=1536 RepID=A0ABU0JRH1_HATLI|nr:pseudouridine synthase [Hathewaya limosa]AWZ47849.1 16S rRNA pseudouridine(516) synthase [Clostridiaceae bacterium 14S0207]MDQ0479035.1 16S rRNA pseudouridine516 synthase [Hathewaya limosa]
MERLDKVLANLGYGTRKEVKGLVKRGEVLINGNKVKDSAIKVDPYKDEIIVGEEKIVYKEFIYLMMNKPDGVVSATFDNYDETVIDLLEEEDKVFEPFPVGRLDKDTVGLLLLTNDGELNHKLISPKKHVDKVYYAQIDREVDKKDINAFEKGIVLDDGYKCMPGKLEILDSTEDGSNVLVTIQEGKFHQVKRMFQSREKKVVYLKRQSFGPIDLDEELNEGEYRELTDEEINLLKNLNSRE